MMAAIAVLKLRRRPMSSVALASAWCATRRSSRCFGVSTPRSSGGAAPADTCNLDRKSTRLNSSHTVISYAVFCLKKKKNTDTIERLCGKVEIELMAHVRGAEMHWSLLHETVYVELYRDLTENDDLNMVHHAFHHS